MGSLSYFTVPWKANVFTQERYRTIPVQKGVRRRVAFTRVQKKINQTVPKEVQKLGGTSFNLMKKISFLTSVGSLSYFTVPWKAKVYHSSPKRGKEKGCVHTGTEKINQTVPKQVQNLGSTSFNLMKKISFLTSVGSLSYFTAPWKANMFTQELYRTVPVQKVVRRRVAFTRVRKKSTGPFQNRSRNCAVLLSF